MDISHTCRSGHNKHLCYLENIGFHEDKPKAYKALINTPKFMCKKCKRKAASARNLCNPQKI